VDIKPGAVSQEMLAARVSLITSTASEAQTLGQGLVRAIWTDDEALSTRISRHVAHYIGQAELAQAIQDRFEAHKAGDDDTAAAELGRAVALAHESGNQDTAKLVDVVDGPPGRSALKPGSPTRTRWHLTPDRARPSGSGSKRQGKNRVYTGSGCNIRPRQNRLF
jgi:hypothetical protein